MSRKKSNNSADVRLWSRTVMGNLSRKRNLAAYVNERNFPFVVQIAVPDDGFGSRLDAINAWHLYSKNKQRRVQPQSIGEKKFWRWCFKDFETAEKFRLRFGGEVLSGPFRRVDRRSLDCTRVVDKVSCDTNKSKVEATPWG
jgi:hypothetical protein